MMEALDAGEVLQRRRLRRMKMVPLALLLLMAVIFALTLNRPGVWAYVHAFSEAAMVGALADWFAVTALFRHPLGIPIPHTAIIRRRKDEIGDSMARFVADHFLIPEAIRSKLAQANLARLLSQWLGRRETRESLGGNLAQFIAWLADAAGQEEVQAFLLRLARRQIEGLPVTRIAGRTLQVLTDSGRHRGLVTEVLRFLMVLLHDNRERIRQQVRSESPWWLPGFVDDAILKQMLDRIETLLLEMSLDDDHELRHALDRWLAEVADALESDPVLAERVNDALQGFLAHPQLGDYWLQIWRDFSRGLAQQAEQPDSDLRRALDTFLLSLATELSSDEAMRGRINAWMERAAVALVAEHRHAIASLISDTVASWDSEDTSNRVELAIGRDLQFIRINGTLVGGLVGLIIHALTSTLGG